MSSQSVRFSQPNDIELISISNMIMIWITFASLAATTFNIGIPIIDAIFFKLSLSVYTTSTSFDHLATSSNPWISMGTASLFLVSLLV